MLTTDVPGGSLGKESACNVGDPGSILGLGRSPGGGDGNPLQYSCLGNPMDRRSLAGYSPWGCKGSKTTEHIRWLQHRRNFSCTICNFFQLLPKVGVIYFYPTDERIHM